MNKKTILVLMSSILLTACADGPFDYSWEEDKAEAGGEVGGEVGGGAGGGAGGETDTGASFPINLSFANSDLTSSSLAGGGIDVRHITFVGSDGNPLTRVGVGLASITSAAENGEVYITGDTNTRGEYRIDLSAGEYLIHIEMGEKSAYRKLKLFEQNTTSNITVSIPATCDENRICSVDTDLDESEVSGVIHGDEGSLAGEGISLLGEDRAILDSSTTDETGQYSLKTSNASGSGFIAIPGAGGEVSFQLDNASYIGVNFNVTSEVP